MVVYGKAKWRFWFKWHFLCLILFNFLLNEVDQGGLVPERNWCQTFVQFNQNGSRFIFVVAVVCFFKLMKMWVAFFLTLVKIYWQSSMKRCFYWENLTSTLSDASAFLYFNKVLIWSVENEFTTPRKSLDLKELELFHQIYLGWF